MNIILNETSIPMRTILKTLCVDNAMKTYGNNAITAVVSHWQQVMHDPQLSMCAYEMKENKTTHKCIRVQWSM